jgi:hypothetical protein
MKSRSWFFAGSSAFERVITRDPLAVVTARGSYHSRLFVAQSELGKEREHEKKRLNEE